MILNDILNDVYLEVPGCANEIMKQQLRLTAREFCTRTEAWTDYVTKSIVANTESYNLNTGYSANIHRILWVKYGTSATLDTTSPLAVNQYKLDNEWTLTLLFDCPTAITNGLYVKMALRPVFGGVSTDANDLPEWFIDRYAEFLSAGVKSRLMRMPRKPWSNPELSRHYESIYSQGIVQADINEHCSEFKNGVMTVQLQEL